MPRNIKLLLAYDGTAYSGWERQKEAGTLQGTLEKAIASLTGESVNVLASGRTDAGVHALGQVANFHTRTKLDNPTIHRALNALLPHDFRVLDVQDVDEEFHATHSAKNKMYRYAMFDESIMDPFLRRFVYHCHWTMDDEAMQRAAQCLLGTHDFSSFETGDAPRRSSVRTVTRIAIFRGGIARLWSRQSGTASSEAKEPVREFGAAPAPDRANQLLFLEVAANGFLYNMVRTIAGTLLNVGRGYWPADAVPAILTACDRTRAGPTAPPHGLFLVRVDY